MNFSEIDYNEVSNSDNDAKTFGRKNVYNLQLINETSFEITVNMRQAADVKIPAGKTREFKGHPDFPFDVALKVKFNTIAPAPKTDFLTIITTQTNGGRLKQC